MDIEVIQAEALEEFFVFPVSGVAVFLPYPLSASDFILVACLDVLNTLEWLRRCSGTAGGSLRTVYSQVVSRFIKSKNWQRNMAFGEFDNLLMW